MSNQQKQYAYGGNDAGDTDAYVSGIAGNRTQNTQYTNFDSEQQSGGRMWYSTDAEPVYRNKCSRAIVIGVSTLLFIIGVGVMVLGKVEQDKKVLPLCPHCDDLITACYAVGGALAFIALLGLAGSLTRVRCLAYIYSIFLIILALVCAAAGFAVVAFDTNLKMSDVQTLWDDAVSSGDSFICDVQNEYKCSGFSTCCMDNAILCPNYTVAECLGSCNSSNFYLESCQQKVVDEVKSHFPPLMGATFGLTFVLLVTAIASVRMTRKS